MSRAKQHAAAATAAARALAPQSSGLRLVGRAREQAEAEAIPPPGTLVGIYARKSPDDKLLAVEQASIARQIARAREMAERHGWIVVEECIRYDDQVSGADFGSDRPGLELLLRDLKARRFAVLIVSEESRIAREMIESLYMQKMILSSGVRLFCYLDGGREVRLDTVEQKTMAGFRAGSDDMERVKARQRSSDAGTRKAAAGFCTGRKVYGYDRDKKTVGGRPSHTEWLINAIEAEIVVRIYERYRDGAGLKRICHELDDAGIRPPSFGGKRPSRHWQSTTIAGILDSPMYRGEIVYGKRRNRDQFGRRVRGRLAVPEREWIRVEAPHVRIVDDVLWYAVQARRRATADAARAVGSGDATVGGGQHGRDRDSAHLLVGFARCPECGGPIAAKSRLVTETNAVMAMPPKERPRHHLYGCLANQNSGRRACGMRTTQPTVEVDGPVLSAIVAELRRPSLVADVAKRVRTKLQPANAAGDAKRLAKQIAALERDARRIGEQLIARPSPTLRAMLDEREAELSTLRARAAQPSPTLASLGIEDGEIEAHLRAEIASWCEALAGGVASSRALLRRILTGPIMLTPVAGRATNHSVEAKRAFRFRGVINLRAFFGLSTTDGSGTQTDATWQAPFEGIAA